MPTHHAVTVLLLLVCVSYSVLNGVIFCVGRGTLSSYWFFCVFSIHTSQMMINA